jgi:hypothetical protein
MPRIIMQCPNDLSEYIKHLLDEAAPPAETPCPVRLSDEYPDSFGQRLREVADILQKQDRLAFVLEDDDKSPELDEGRLLERLQKAEQERDAALRALQRACRELVRTISARCRDIDAAAACNTREQGDD